MLILCNLTVVSGILETFDSHGRGFHNYNVLLFYFFQWFKTLGRLLYDFANSIAGLIVIYRSWTQFVVFVCLTGPNSCIIFF